MVTSAAVLEQTDHPVNAPKVVFPSLTSMPEATYRSEKALSQSVLKKMGEHGRAAQLYEIYGMEPTAAMILGTRMHKLFEMMALEPDTKISDLFVSYKGKRQGKAYDTFKASVGDREVLSVTEMGQMEEVYATIRRKQTIQTLLNTSTHVEPAVFWEDKLTGLRCKGRPDLLCDSLIVDFKTTTDLSDRGIQNTIAGLGYDVQAGFYLDGVNTATAGGYESFVFIFLQTKAPFDARVIRLPDEWVDIGRKKYKQYIAEYKACQDEFGDSEWPGHPDYMTEIEIPNWLKQQENTK